MCGLAGYSGVKGANIRFALTMALGLGIDSRGGHAAGYVSLPETASGKAIRLAKRIGKWGDASARFVYGASLGRVCMMHSRYATCGSKDNVQHAHPFVIRREGKSVLYGAHNGVLTGTWSSAKRNNREHTVDSREMLELLADKEYSAIKELEGYGVVTWVTPAEGAVNVVRLSRSSDFIACHLKEGGIAWASTWAILSAALKVANLTADETILTTEIGQVYKLTPKGAIAHVDHPPVLVKPDEPWSKRTSYSGSSYFGSYYDHDLTGDEWDWKQEEKRYNQSKAATGAASKSVPMGFHYRGVTPVNPRPPMPEKREPNDHTVETRDEKGNWIGTVFGSKPSGMPKGKLPADAYSVLPSGKCYLRHYFSEAAYKYQRAEAFDQTSEESWLDAANRCADMNKAAIVANDAKWDALQKAQAFMAENDKLRKEAAIARLETFGKPSHTLPSGTAAETATTLATAVLTSGDADSVAPTSRQPRFPTAKATHMHADKYPTAKSLLDEWDDMYLKEQARKDARRAYSADERATGLIGTADDYHPESERVMFSGQSEPMVRIDVTCDPDSNEEIETETDIDSLALGMTLSDYLGDERK